MLTPRAHPVFFDEFDGLKMASKKPLNLEFLRLIQTS